MERPEGGGWIPGWTFAPPLEALRNETLSPLGVTLSDTPGRLNITAPGTGLSFSLRTGDTTRCLLRAGGLRMITSTGNHDAVASICMPDPTSLIIEADRSLLDDLDEDNGFTVTAGEAFKLTEDAQHRVSVLADLEAVPVRVAVVSGTGDRAGMSARARGLLVKSAHAGFDALLQDGRPDATPAEFVRSRLRCATGSIPCPWIAGDDEEPVWNQTMLYPFFRALLEDDEDAASGLILNIIELSGDRGQPPAAGGSIGPVMYEDEFVPLLGEMCAAAHRRTRRLPAAGSAILSAVNRSLNLCIDHAREDEPDAALRLEWLRVEVDAFRYLLKTAGEQTSRTYRATIEKAAGFLSRPAVEPAASSPAAHLARLCRNPSAPPGSLNGPAAEARAAILEEPENTAEPALFLVASDLFMRRDYRAYSIWAREAADLAGKVWTRRAVSLASGRGITGMAFAAMLACVDAGGSRSFNRILLREQAVASFIERHRKGLMRLGAAAAVLLIAFIVSVLFRDSMPTSVYETNIGMSTRLYASGQLDEALALIEEMEKRGASRHIRVQYLKGKVYFKQRNFEAAAGQFALCDRLQPGNPAFIYNQALSHYYLGDSEKARELFTVVAERHARTNPSLAASAARAIEITEKTSVSGKKGGNGGEKNEERGAPRRSG